MSEDNYKDIFDQAVSEGLDKNGVLMKLITDGGLDVTAAVREYNRLARESGLTMSKEQKEAKIQEILSEQSLETKEGVDEAKDALVEALDVAPTTAMGYIKAFAEENDIELPVGQRKTMASKPEVVAYLVAHKGEKKADMSKGLCEEFGYAKGTADTIVSHLEYMEEYAKQTGS